jgi:DNA-binding CsgD family transcriptional regulator
VAQSAINKFFQGIEKKKFTQLRDRNDLWFLLAMVTAQKARDHAQRAHRKKRGGGWNDLGDSVLVDVAAAETSPSDEVMMAEELDRLLNALGDETLRQIAIWKMQDYTIKEIAQRLGRSPRTVSLKLELIKRRWIEGGHVELDWLLKALGDETLRQIAQWKREGNTIEEIAQRLGCSPRTVSRKLKLNHGFRIEGGDA